jgi:hypothetical protein
MPPQREDDVKQNQQSNGQRRAAQGRGQESRRVCSYAVPLGANLDARLAYFKFRFLRRHLLAGASEVC